MDERVKEQILAIRDTGLTNMFDVPVVQRLAYERDPLKYIYMYLSIWLCWVLVAALGVFSCSMQNLVP